MNLYEFSPKKEGSLYFIASESKQGAISAFNKYMEMNCGPTGEDKERSDYFNCIEHAANKLINGGQA